MKSKTKFGCSLVTLVTLISFPSASADTTSSLDVAKQNLLGEWQVGYRPGSFVGGAKTPLRKLFLTGNVGPIWRFDDDGSTTAFVPCDINEVFRKGVVARGTWALLDGGTTLEVKAQMTVATKEPLELKGPLVFELVGANAMKPTSMTFGNRPFGRYNDQVFICD